VLAVLGAAVLISAGCKPQPPAPPKPSPSASPSPAPSTGPTPSSSPTSGGPVTHDGAYTFRPLGMGGTGFVTGLVVHPTTPGVVYGREDVGGIVGWDERTRTWTQLMQADRVPDPVASDYGGESIAVAASNDQVVFAAVGTGDNGRILTSTDRGKHWHDSGFRTYIEGNNDYRTGPERLVIDPVDDQVAFFGSRTAGLYTTADGGAHWTQVPTTQIPAAPAGTKIGVPFVLFDPTSSRAGRTQRVWAGVAGEGVYLSENGGSTWTKVYSTTVAPQDAKMAADGTLYVTYTTSIRRFTPANHGGADVTAPSAGNGFFLGVDPHDSNRLLATSQAVTPGNLFRSTDGGRTWDTLTYTLASADIQWPLHTTESGYLSTGTFVFDPTRPGRVWFPQGVGVWRSDDVFDSDTAVTWNFVSQGIEEAVTNDLVAPPGGSPVSAIADRNGFTHENLDGYPDRTVLTDEFSAGTSVAYAGQNPSYIAMVSSDTRAQYQPVDTAWTTKPSSGYSTDGGRTWTLFGGDKSQISSLYGGNIAVSADAKSLVWQPSIPAFNAATPDNAPEYSTDNGKTWKKSTGVAAGTGIHDQIWWGSKRALDADTVTPGVFYLYTVRNGGEFFRSTDGGASWTRTAGRAPTGDGNDSHVFGQIHAVPGKAGNVWSSNAQGGLSYTLDSGASWTKVPAVQEAKAFGFGKAATAGGYPTVFANAKIDGVWGVYRSTDRGATWSLVSKYPAGYYTSITVVTGSMDVAGRVFVGFGTNGVVYGDVTTGH
jgi:hypothetical protein